MKRTVTLKSDNETLFDGEALVTEENGRTIYDLDSAKTGMTYSVGPKDLIIESKAEADVTVRLSETGSEALIDTDFGSFAMPVELELLEIGNDLIVAGYSLEGQTFKFVLELKG